MSPASEQSADRTVDVWGTRRPYAQGARWPTRVDTYLKPGVGERDVERWVGSACVLCSNGCGLEIAVKDGEMVGVRGRESDRVNHGRLGPKGLYGWQGGRAPQLAEAAPTMWVEVNAADAGAAGVADGDPVRVVSPRGSLETTVRVTDVPAGQVIAPFHYGDRAANELTMTVWDPVSKQPVFKVAACRLEKAGGA